MNIRELTEKLCAIYGPSGREGAVADAIEEMAAPFVDSVERDALGNLICKKHGAGQRVMLAAHMDQIGYIVTDIDEKGYLRVYNVGGIAPALARNRAVVFGNGVPGVVSGEIDGWDPAHPDMTKLFIDIGARDRADAESSVSVGDIAVSAPGFRRMKNGFVSSPALDDRVGCAVLLGTLMELGESDCDITAVFTVQEEVGQRGARAAAFDAKPDLAVAIDVTLEGGVPKGPKIAVRCGEGPCVKIMDSSLVTSPAVVEKMERAAARAGVKWQREVLTAGRTDAGVIQISRAGVASGVLSIPCRYVHSPAEAVCMRDAEDGVKLLRAMLEEKR